MRTMHLLDELKFRDNEPFAEPLLVDSEGRILRFCLQPHQRIVEHNVPHSPLYMIVLQGEGVFAGSDGREVQIGPNSLMVFDPGENHTVRALDEELVLVGFLQGVSGTREDRTGGVMGNA
ncbi:MAG: cupin domain-containing protein [Caldilinea sp.]|jgi:quercetin dioxygenase-like cupin family protein